MGIAFSFSFRKKELPLGPLIGQVGSMTGTPSLKSWPSPASDADRRGGRRREALRGCPGSDPRRNPDQRLGLRGSDTDPVSGPDLYVGVGGCSTSPDRLLGPAEESVTLRDRAPSPFHCIFTPQMLCRPVLVKMGPVHVNRGVNGSPPPPLSALS